MSTYYVKTKGTTIANGSRVEQGSDNTNYTGWPKANPFIYCVAIGQDTRDPPAAVLKLQWRVSGGSFADLGATGALKYTTNTDLTNDNAVATGEKLVSVSNMTWQDGYEVEDGVAPSIDLGSDCYSELQFAIDPSGATDGSTYEFQLYNSTLGAVVAVESGSMMTVTMQVNTTLVVADASHVLSSDNVALTENKTLAGVADAGHVLSSGNVALTENKTLAGVADTSHVLSSEEPNLTQVHALAVQDSAHALDSDIPTLTEESSSILLEVSDGNHSQGADNLDLTQAHTLQVSDASHVLSSDNVSIVQAHALALQDSSHSHASDTPNLTQVHNLTIQDGSHSHASDSFVLTQVHNLVPSDCGHGLYADAINLVQIHNISVDDCLHAHTADGIELIASGDTTLTIQDAYHGPTPMIMSSKGKLLKMISSKFYLEL